MRYSLVRMAMVAGLTAVTGAAGWIAPIGAAGAATKRVAAAADPVYAKECGSCHMPFSPELLPARSWRRVMDGLGDHFGESAQVDAPTQESITQYLTAHAADRATNEQSMEIMHSLRAGDAPVRITQVPYIAGLHAAALDPLRGGNPRPKTLAECGVCHQDVASGNYTERRYSVTDQGFRSGIGSVR